MTTGEERKTRRGEWLLACILLAAATFALGRWTETEPTPRYTTMLVGEQVAEDGNITYSFAVTDTHSGNIKGVKLVSSLFRSGDRRLRPDPVGPLDAPDDD